MAVLHIITVVRNLTATFKDCIFYALKNHKNVGFDR